MCDEWLRVCITLEAADAITSAINGPSWRERMAAQRRAKPKRPSPSHTKIERNNDIVRLRGMGWSARQIATVFGISASRVIAILKTRAPP